MSRSLFTSIALTYTATLLLVGTSKIGQVHASPTADLVQRQNEGITSTSRNNEVCGFDGNSDMYGLGIRVGVYVQTATTIIATCHKRKAASDLVKTGGLFQFAALVALIQQTVNNEKLYAVEALVTYLFCFTSIGINLAEPIDKVQTQNRLEQITLPSLVSMLRLTTALGLDCYQTWFWFTGLDKLERTPCKTETFFLARVNAHGRFRTFAKIWSVFIMAVVTFTLYLKLRKSIEEKKKPAGTSTTRSPIPKTKPPDMSGPEFVRLHVMGGLKVDDDLNGPWRRVMASSIVPVMVVLAVELTIRWNNVRGAHSSEWSLIGIRIRKRNRNNNKK
ncbi:hypothetical protein N7499_012263 [Penicillium canescens]|uniref:Uncharacterized protein n=1 Tax=Penicillium canescens TaxID=5083 RepID=A0AAD6N427_PENCN|nr:hypothetical protein N7522_003485 [Penicillium canescens]KAJ6029848.1 hypothetical protein N7460_010114 [Penicillium canescens]KAJ6060228.1 hypothetical protein N7444_002082 [Penicillium canescens]KAJ6063583.1 hypothetical protein N7499_012263 [Penicillium canescens]